VEAHFGTTNRATDLEQGDLGESARDGRQIQPSSSQDRLVGSRRAVAMEKLIFPLIVVALADDRDIRQDTIKHMPKCDDMSITDQRTGDSS
jgi:hypothetical protein